MKTSSSNLPFHLALEIRLCEEKGSSIALHFPPNPPDLASAIVKVEVLPLDTQSGTAAGISRSSHPQDTKIIDFRNAA